MKEFSKNYDLEERTAKFGEVIITLCKSIMPNNIANPLVNQLIRSGTGIGANYMEANAASSKKDFKNKIFICKKEAQETKHWLRMIAFYSPDQKKDIRKIWQECQELTLIFSKILSTMMKIKN